MIHSEVFLRFVEDSPVSVMTQALLENTLSPTTVDSLFETHAVSQYTRDLLFSDIVLLMSLVGSIASYAWLGAADAGELAVLGPVEFP